MGEDHIEAQSQHHIRTPPSQIENKKEKKANKTPTGSLLPDSSKDTRHGHENKC
jgi:hypothetical protein